MIERAGGLEVADDVIRRMQDRPLTLSDRYTKLNMRALPAWKQDHDDVGTYYCILFMLPDGTQVSDSNWTRIARRRVLRPVVRIDVALAFQRLRDIPNVGDIAEARRDIEPAHSPYLLMWVVLIVSHRARACLLTLWWDERDDCGMSRTRSLSDVAWGRLEPLMPVAARAGGRPFQDHRRVLEGIIWRFRTGSPWRDLPAEFGPWQTAWKRHRRFSADGTWDKIHAELLAEADAVGGLDWAVSVDSTVNRAHQHATNLPRDTGGPIELQETMGRTR